MNKILQLILRVNLEAGVGSRTRHLSGKRWQYPIALIRQESELLIKTIVVTIAGHDQRAKDKKWI